MIIFFAWLGACLFIAAMAKFEDPAIKGDQLKVIKGDNTVYAMAAFMLFGMLWIFQFIGDKTKYITMVSAATYYFDSNP